MILVQADLLRRAITAVLPATTTEYSRYELDCVKVSIISDGSVVAEAMNGRRLMSSHVDAYGKTRAATALIERRSARAFCKELRGLKTGLVALELPARDRVRWRPEGEKKWRMITLAPRADGEARSDEFKFPDTDALMPTGDPIGVMRVSIAELMTTARQAWTCVNRDAPAMTLTLTPGGVHAHSECSEACFDRDVDAAYQGRQKTASYNPRLIEDALRPLRVPKGAVSFVEVEFHKGRRGMQILIRAPEVMCLIAPVKIAHRSKQWKGDDS